MRLSSLSAHLSASGDRRREYGLTFCWKFVDGSRVLKLNALSLGNGAIIRAPSETNVINFLTVLFIRLVDSLLHARVIRDLIGSHSHTALAGRPDREAIKSF